MPLVYIHHRSDGRYPKIAAGLAQTLPGTVALNLSMDAGQSEEVVSVNPKTIRTMLMPANPQDVNPFDIGIVIWAHNFPGRVATARLREESIRSAVKSYVAGNAAGFVTLNLIHMEVGTF